MRWFESRRQPPTETEELFKRVERLAAVVSRIETEWADTKDQVRRSYQRLEQAGRAASRKAEVLAPTPQRVLPLGANLDPFSRKLLEVRSFNDDNAPGIDESAG